MNTLLNDELLARVAFHHFGGWREFNPLAVVFRPLRRTRTFRFWQPFRDFTHGYPEALHRIESEFFALIGVQRHEPSADERHRKVCAWVRSFGKDAFPCRLHTLLLSLAVR
jgi:hypothetical protein